ncbi:AraC family transcriptional regulator [Sinimarinibacterium thermocellulolyticum]|uniref:AraC family transcriptional regulator n=1 Tax=Sinimarinibacterium thermocellulolyticum TaxID=3170016 RepID=A0ABV2A5N5_9GAMM
MADLIRASVLAGFPDLAAKLGGDPASILRRFHLEGVSVESAHEFVPYHNVVRMMEATAAELDCADLGLRLAGYQSLDKLGPLALLVTNCTTVGAALRTLTRNLHTYSPSTTLRLVEPPAGPVRFEYDVLQGVPGVPHRVQKTEFSLAFMHAVLGLLIGPSYRPRAVLFRHEPNKPADVYRRHFGVVPRFGAEVNAIELTQCELQQPLEIVAPIMRRAIDEYLQPMIDRQPLSIERQVAELIARMLPSGNCRLASVAAQMSMHERTLQRHLAQAGLVFEDMLDRIRRERALELLADRRIPLAHVAGLLGYSEQSTFSRACRRWYRQAPGAQRRLLTQARAHASPA